MVSEKNIYLVLNILKPYYSVLVDSQAYSREIDTGFFGLECLVKCQNVKGSLIFLNKYIGEISQYIVCDFHHFLSYLLPSTTLPHG